MVSSTHTLGLSPPESSSASVKTFLPSIPSTLTSISPLSSPEPKAFSTRSPTLPLPPPQTPPYRKNNGWFGFISDDMEVVLKLNNKLR
nr:hypothetical protein CFP56_55430 [Quercus suber]